jgi:hypothetical protein
VTTTTTRAGGSVREPELQGRRPPLVVVLATLVAGGLALGVGWGKAFGLDPNDVLTGAVLIALASTAAALSLRAGVAAVLALVAVWLLGYAVYDVIPGALDTHVPVEDAVGAAAYFRTPYFDQQVAGAVLLAVAFLIGAGLARWGVFRDPRARSDSPVVASRSTVDVRSARRLTIGGTAAVILTLLPDLQQVLIRESSGLLPPGWDVANLITWDYLLQEGLKPMGDFWYPYGGFWLMQDFPTGPVVRFVWQGSLLAVAAWSLWRLVGPRPGRITLCLVAIVAVGLLDAEGILYPPIFWRYLPGFILPLTYAAVGPLRHRRLTFGHLVLAAVCAATAVMEADVLVIGLGGAAFVALGELFFEPDIRGWRRVSRALAVDLVPVAAGVAVMLLFWVATGAFEQSARWYAGFQSVSAYSAAEEDVLGALAGLSVGPSIVTLLATVPALVLIAGFAHRRSAGPSATTTSRLLFAAAGASGVILAKHLVRPQSWIVLVIPLVALLWTVILQWRPRALPTGIAAGLSIGAVLAVLQLNGNVKPTSFARDVAKLPVRVVDDFRVVLERDELHAAANRRFAPARFAALPEKLYIADKVGSALAGPGAAPGDNRFATLGDAQILYVLFHQRPPDYITLYDASPRSEQRRLIDSLSEMRPARLVWRRDLNVDLVPYWVRNPLVFAYAIQHYVPESERDPMDLLRLRRPGEPVALGYWRKRLGRDVSLGGIPSYSRGADHRHCQSSPGCAPYAIVSGHPHTDGTEIRVRVDGRGGPYGVTFATRKGVGRYAIRLDRLWYWPLAGARTVRVTSETPGWTVEKVSVSAGSDLY